MPYHGEAVKEAFEELKRVDPDLVLTHTRDDLHQDHRLACELTWNTFRDHLILEYEIPKWDGDLGRPNLFVPLEDGARRAEARPLLAHFRASRKALVRRGDVPWPDAAPGDGVRARRAATRRRSYGRRSCSRRDAAGRHESPRHRHHGYIGSVLAPDRSRRPVTTSSGSTRASTTGCDFGRRRRASRRRSRRDVRDVDRRDLEGFDAVVHLAALSNDPLGDLNPELDLRHQPRRDAVALARAAKEAGVGRFVFASSCSMYGAPGRTTLLDEDAPLRPLTPYAESKVRAEEALAELADDDFAPVSMRNATAYGASPRLRLDIVLNNLAGWAHTTGRIRLLSDGTAWRPLVHVRDIARVARRDARGAGELVRGQAFNVGSDEQNYRIRDLAERRCAEVTDCEVEFAGDASPDPRRYRVDFSKLARAFPDLALRVGRAARRRGARRRLPRVRLDRGGLRGPTATFGSASSATCSTRAARGGLRWATGCTPARDALRRDADRGRLRGRARAARRRARLLRTRLVRDEFAAAGLDAELAQCSLSRNRRGPGRCAGCTSSTRRTRRRSSCAAPAARSSTSSSTCGRTRRRTARWLGVELDAGDGRALYVPEGFAHGFQTLADDTEVLYMISRPYVPEAPAASAGTTRRSGSSGRDAPSGRSASGTALAGLRARPAVEGGAAGARRRSSSSISSTRRQRSSRSSSACREPSGQAGVAPSPWRARATSVATRAAREPRLAASPASENQPRRRPSRTLVDRRLDEPRCDRRRPRRRARRGRGERRGRG